MADKEKETSKKEERKAEKAAAQIEELQAKLAEAEKKAEEAEARLAEAEAKSKDELLRLMAEFDNFRRRTSAEKMDLVSSAAKDTITGMLPVLDDCERALKVLADSDDSDAAKEGTQLIYDKLMTYLKGKGLAVIDAMGQEFNTDLHEAVAQFPVQEDDKKGKVFDVVLTGYTLNGKVIRYAKVVVGI